MKKCIIPMLLILALLAGCMSGCMNSAADASSKKTGTETSADQGKGEKITLYDSDGISFDIPEAWQQNFKAVTREAGSSGNTYPQTEFYYTDGNRDIRLMTIGKFTREQWDKLKAETKDAENALLGESADKKHVYSLSFENHDYITEASMKEMLGKLRTEAEKLRDKIKVK